MIVQAVFIPLFQALITGGFATAVVTSFIILIGLPHPWSWGGFVGAFTALFSWLGYIDKFYRALTGVQEKRNSKPRDYQFRVQAIEPDGHTGFFLSLPFDQVKFNLLCKHVVKHDFDFSQAGLAGPGKPLSRAEFEATRTQMLDAGLVRWKSPHAHNTGCELSPAGRSIVRRYAE